MNTLQSILNALFFAVNSCAVLFIVIAVTRVIKRMERKLDYHISLMRYVKARQSMTFLSILKDVMNSLIKTEHYEEAAKVKKLMDDELEELNDEHFKTK